MKLFLVLAVFFAIAFLAFRVLKKQPKKGNGVSGSGISLSASKKDQNRFLATKIIPGDNACQASRDLQDSPFLNSEVNTPNLPLAECTQVANCRCKYVHQSDRRSDDDDRRDPSPLRSDLYLGTDGDDKRSQKRGRRNRDQA